MTNFCTKIHILVNSVTKSTLTIYEVFQHFEFLDKKWAFGTVCYTVVIVMEYKTWRFVEEQLHSFFPRL